MNNLSKWNITVESGPTAADIHDIVVDASSSTDAISKAKQWAEDHNIQNPMLGEPYEDTYEEILEWTTAEEEEFFNMVNIDHNDLEG